ncbi:hypothetical protein NM96_03145 [Neisseria mucosa]|nr:hypothetical protein NM96_03145 [Neisseria mucosa]
MFRKIVNNGGKCTPFADGKKVFYAIENRSPETTFQISDDLGFGFQVQHQGTSGWNRFKNKTLGVS